MNRTPFVSIVKYCLAALLISVAEVSAGADNTLSADKTAEQVAAESGIQGGLIVHLGSRDGRATAKLSANRSFIVQALNTDPEIVAQIRKDLAAAGVSDRISVNLLETEYLPYIDNLVNLLICEDLCEIPESEVMRVLTPDGVAYIRDNEQWIKRRKPRPDEIDEWTHYLHGPDNNAVSNDLQVGPPAHLQWKAGPTWSRHHELMTSFSAMVSAGGRVFFVIDEGSRISTLLPAKWRLAARDAFNGKLLWKRAIPFWHSHLYPLKSGPAMLPRRLAAVGDRVYVTMGEDLSVHEIDASTGETTRIYPNTENTRDLVVTDDFVFVAVDPKPVIKTDFAWKGRDAHRFHGAVLKERTWTPEELVNLTVFQRKTGKKVWSVETAVAPQALAANQTEMVYHDGSKIHMVENATGKELWTTETPPLKRVESNFAPILILKKERVLWGPSVGKWERSPVADPMYVYDRKTGTLAWEGEQLRGGCTSSGDLFVVNDEVWSGQTRKSGRRHAWTGCKILDGSDVINFKPTNTQGYWFHARCHRAKATVRYFITGQTGIEYTDRENHTMVKNHWVRGACLYGVMPANGLTYVPPHPCACYNESQLNGFNALAAARKIPLPITAEEHRLSKGPAYGSALSNTDYPETDWPMYRHDPQRSSYSPASVKPDLKTPSWKASIGGRLSAPAIAGGLCLVSAIDTHSIHALDVDSGKERWMFTAGASVDSAPSFYRGRVYFGSSDGYLYCLRASDGAMVWRYLVAPSPHRLLDDESIKCVWPVHGSVVIRKNVVHVMAGRSFFLDGGVRYCLVDAETGKLLSETTLDDKLPESLVQTEKGRTETNLQDTIRLLSMPVAKTDILSYDDHYVYMGSQKFDFDGHRAEILRSKMTWKTGEQDASANQQGKGTHLFAPAGFLDDSWFHRNYWLIGQYFQSGCNFWFRNGRYTPSARIMAFDGKKVYGYGRDPRFLLWTTAMRNQLFRADMRISKDAVDRVVQENSGKKENVFDLSKSRNKPLKGSSVLEFDWRIEEPDIVVRAMCLTSSALFVAGPPNLIDEDTMFDSYLEEDAQERIAEQEASYSGRKGALLRMLSNSDGTTLAEYRLETQPVFDGMAAAKSALFVTMTDGTVQCFE